MVLSQRFNVVIPTCNGAEFLPKTIQSIGEFFSGDCKIVIIENGSNPIQKAALRELILSYSGIFDIELLQSEKGFGNALRASTLNLNHELTWITGDDLPFGFSHFDDLHFPLNLNQVVIASKSHARSKVSRKGSRRLYSFVFRYFRRLVLGLKIGDTQGDFILSTELLQKYICRTTEKGFLFTTQLCFLMHRDRVQFNEVPVRLNDLRSASRVKFRDLVDMSIGIFRIRFRAIG